MEDLATVAAVSRTTIYRHFPSHDALLSEVQARYGLAPNAAATAKSLVLDAAAALILEVGLAGLTVQGVADRAGVSPMTVYKTFGDKSTLLAAVFVERGPGVGLDALLPPADPGPCVPALRGLTVVGLRHCHRHRVMLRHIFCPAPSMGGVWDLALRAARATSWRHCRASSHGWASLLEGSRPSPPAVRAQPPLLPPRGGRGRQPPAHTRHGPSLREARPPPAWRTLPGCCGRTRTTASRRSSTRRLRRHQRRRLRGRGARTAASPAAPASTPSRSRRCPRQPRARPV
jgi:AcrR family transcriptional regulator